MMAVRAAPLDFAIREAEPITSVGDAVQFFLKIPRQPDKFLIFRGHGDYEWRLTSPISRQADGVKERENELVRELISVSPSAFLSDQTMFDRLVRMQHFELPTRLLDTTANPLVALYFACEEMEDGADGAVVIIRGEAADRKFYDSDTVGLLTNLANLAASERRLIEETAARTLKEFNDLQAVDRLVQFIRHDNPAFRPRVRRNDLFRRVHVIPKMNNPRIVAQAGSFIVFGLDRTKAPEVKPNMVVKKIRVAAESKEAILRELASLGITESTLFPEMDRAAHFIVRRLQQLS